jgi:hypothetical protein
MERNRIGTLVGCVTAIGFLLAPARTLAVGAEQQGRSPAVEHTGGETRTLGELWRATKIREAELGQLVQAKELGKVHEAAFAIRDLVAAMPEKSGQLSSEQRARLEGNVKFVATLAKRLDASGDTGDQTGTEASFQQLRSVLAAIGALYPEGVLQ